MRVKIIGENDCARAARGLLRQAGFAVTEFLPADAVTQGPLAGYVITIVEDARADKIYVDSIDCPLEAAILKHITQLSKHPVVVNRPGGLVHSDREIGLIVPQDEEEKLAVEFGVLRGLLELGTPAKITERPAPAAASWYQRIFS
jgi:hypothetical protein